MSDIKDNVSYAFREPGCEVTALEMESDYRIADGLPIHVLDFINTQSAVKDLANELKLRGARFTKLLAALDASLRFTTLEYPKSELRILELLRGEIREFFCCGMHTLTSSIVKHEHATLAYIDRELKSALDKLKKYRDKYGDLENE